MANIPAPDLPDVAPRPLPTPYESTAGVTPDAFGAAAGRSLERVGGVAHDLYQQEKTYADTAAVLGAEAQAKSALNSIVLDDQKGYRSLKGIDAVAGRDDALQKFNKAVQDAGSTLTNDAQRLHFQQLAKTIQEEGFRYALSHETTEQERYAVGQFRGNVDQTMVTMENPAVVSDPRALGAQIDSLWQTGIQEAQRRYGQGAGKDAIASVVVPELQKAALGGIRAAVETQDPDIAKQAYDVLGKYLVTGDRRMWAPVIQKMAANREIGRQAGAAVGAGLTEVALPDGSTIMRPDAGKISQAIARLPDGPYRDEIVAAADKRQKAYEQQWSQSVAQVSSNALTAGLDPATGKFDMSKVSPAYTVWLRANAPDKLLALGKEDARAQRGDNRADRQVSADNYSDALTSLYDPAQKDTLLNTSMQQFQAGLLDEQKYPGGFTPQDRSKLTKQFGLLQKQNFDEKVGATVKEELRKTFQDPEERDRVNGELFDRANAFALQYEKDNGKPPKTEEIRAYVVQQLAQQPNSGPGGINFFNKRRIDIPRAVPVQATTPVSVPEGRVRVIAPNGQHGSVPAGQIDDLLKQGYRRE